LNPHQTYKQVTIYKFGVEKWNINF
jgi:hypothetical protein